MWGCPRRTLLSMSASRGDVCSSFRHCFLFCFVKTEYSLVEGLINGSASWKEGIIKSHCIFFFLMGSGSALHLFSTFCIWRSFSVVAFRTGRRRPQAPQIIFRRLGAIFTKSNIRAYHQKAGRDTATHAYTIGQEMTVSGSMVKPPLINVGMMKANLSLKGILNRWHLHCLCWESLPGIRSNWERMTGGAGRGMILHLCGFLS